MQEPQKSVKTTTAIPGGFVVKERRGSIEDERKFLQKRQWTGRTSKIINLRGDWDVD